MLIVTGNALGFFTGSGNVIPFSVDLPDFCRSLRVESKPTIKIFIGHDVLLINELHNVIERNSLFQILATIGYKINFWTQNIMICKLCGIVRRDLRSIVAAHRFLHGEKLLKFGKVENWLLIVSRFWWEISQAVGYFVAGRSKLLLLGTFFTEWFFRVASCCFYMVFTDSYLIYKDKTFFLVESTTISIYGRCFLFWGLGASFNITLFFSHSFRVIFPDNLSPYQGTLFLLSDFVRLVVCDVNPRELISQTVCHHKREPCSIWVVFTEKHFHPYS